LLSNILTLDLIKVDEVRQADNTNDSAFGVRSLQVNTLNWIYIIYIYIYIFLQKSKQVTTMQWYVYRFQRHINLVLKYNDYITKLSLQFLINYFNLPYLNTILCHLYHRDCNDVIDYPVETLHVIDFLFRPSKTYM
jgi:hypothetical protein